MQVEQILPKQFKAARAMVDLSMEGLGAMIGRTGQTIYELESGVPGRKACRRDAVEALARLGVRFIERGVVLDN